MKEKGNAMKLKDIFSKSKGNNKVSLLIGVTCLITIMMTLNDALKYNMFSLCYPAEYPWQYFSGIFVHGTSQFPAMASIAHLVFNLMLVLPFGILIEKSIGSNRFSIVTFASWMIQAIAFYVIASIITPENETARGAGISGIAFMYGTIGAYVLFQLFKINKRIFFRQVLTYIYLNILIAMLAMLNPFVAGVSSFIVHLIGVVVGILFVVINHKYINENIIKLSQGEELAIKVSKWNYVWLVVPAFFVVVYLIL